MGKEREEDYTPEGNETYDLMLRLERLESLREDLEEARLNTLSEVEAALALIAPNNNPALQEKHTQLSEIRTELLELELTGLDSLEAEIDRLNEQLDEEDF
jgi:hypothetical protein